MKHFLDINTLYFTIKIKFDPNPLIYCFKKQKITART